MYGTASQWAPVLVVSPLMTGKTDNFPLPRLFHLLSASPNLSVVSLGWGLISYVELQLSALPLQSGLGLTVGRNPLLRLSVSPVVSASDWPQKPGSKYCSSFFSSVMGYLRIGVAV